VANVIMLGALIGIDLLPLTREEIEAEVKGSFSADRVKLNLKALGFGIDSVAPKETTRQRG
jgi:Pyruvate/2-oxoacid:ferredoxin oxidoreductase gamma subunit